MTIGKNYTIYGFVLLVLFWNCEMANRSETNSQPAGYVVTGHIEGIGDGMIYLRHNDLINRTSNLLDSAIVEKGEFTFKGHITVPDEVYVQKEEVSIRFFLENTALHIQADTKAPRDFFGRIDAVIDGSPLNDLYREYLMEEAKLLVQDSYDELTRIKKAYYLAQKNGDVPATQRYFETLEGMKGLSEELNAHMLQTKLEFIKAHPESPISPYVLGNRFSENELGLAKMGEVLSIFSGRAKNTHMFKYFDMEYRAKKRTGLGEHAPGFTLKTPSGTDFSLGHTRGKYVLLDFWASWCTSCRDSYPQLKEVYQKYKDKGFEVVGISIDNDPRYWKAAIAEDGTNWVHILDTYTRKGLPSDVATLYAIPLVPTSVLLDRNGTIIAKNLQSDTLEAVMEDLFEEETQ